MIVERRDGGVNWNAPVSFEFCRDLRVDVAIGPDDEVQLVHFGLGRYRPGTRRLGGGPMPAKKRRPGRGQQKIPTPNTLHGTKFSVHAEAPFCFLFRLRSYVRTPTVNSAYTTLRDT